MMPAVYRLRSRPSAAENRQRMRSKRLPAGRRAAAATSGGVCEGQRLLETAGAVLAAGSTGHYTPQAQSARGDRPGESSTFQPNRLLGE
jgi:hypothetical protein